MERFGLWFASLISHFSVSHFSGRLGSVSASAKVTEWRPVEAEKLEYSVL